MHKIKALILFTAVAAIFALFAYTNVEASGGGLPADCVVLKGIGVCPAEDFRTTESNSDETTDVTFNYTLQRVSGVGRTKFFDILGPDSIDPGTCYGYFKNRDCSNVKIKYNGHPVGNSVYKNGAPAPSRFAAGISDKLVFRARIYRTVPDTPVSLSITFKNQVSPPPSGFTYGQLTRKSYSKFESDKIRGPDEQQAFNNVFQASFEEVRTEPDEGFCLNSVDKKIYDCRDQQTSLAGIPITNIEVIGDGIDCEGGKNITANTNKVLVKVPGSACYVYLYNGYAYSICY